MRVLVIGGSSGIGAAIVARLEADGHQVVALSRSAKHALDLSDTDENIERAVRDAIRSWSGGSDWPDSLDALIVSSGMGAYMGPLEHRVERLTQLFRVNTIGPIVAYRSALRALMRAQGRVIFVTSTVARRPGARDLGAYAATKAALHAFVMCEAKQLAPHGVAMNALAPGWVETPMTAEIKPAKRAAIEKAIPMGRMATPLEVAVFAVQMLTWPHYATGGVHEISGGL
jgi:NAD(P)-dependent dehydrogenase (short-subunit alcohol dehydrogenase family)